MSVHHYPPELLEQLVETIPRLIRSKRGLVDFFASAAVPEAVLADLRRQVQSDRKGINKFDIARTVLNRINEQGDAALRQRREIVKRVVEWEDFSTCWDSDQLKAKGLVAEIRRVVGVKDAFARMSQHREDEAKRNKDRYDAEAAAKQRRESVLAKLRDRLAACFGMHDPHRRGQVLEGILNGYFEEEGVSVREAFHVIGLRGEGTVEQIDGAVEIDGQILLLEMKWWSKPLGVAEIAPFLVKVFSRGGCGGILIAQPGLTAPAVHQLRDALAGGATVAACSLEAVYRLLEARGDLRTFLKARIRSALLERRPFVEAAR